MLRIKGRFKAANVDIVNNKYIIELEAEGDVKALSYELLKMGELSVEFKKFKKKRSLDANSYFWVLADKLAEVTGESKTAIYRNAIKEIGGVSEVVCIKEAAANKLCEGWSKNGLGWQTDIMDSKIKGCKNVVLYYGSSTYDTKQMSMLIDNIVQDCKAVGIETMTPRELAILKENWKGDMNG